MCCAGAPGFGEGLTDLLHRTPLAAALGLRGLEPPKQASDPWGPLARLEPSVSGHLIGYHSVKLSGLASILDSRIGLQEMKAATS